MAERRKGRKKKEDDSKIDDEKPAKIEYEVSKYLRNKLPEKKTTLLTHKVAYFIASKAVDCLLDSPWATGKDVIFTDRPSVVDFLDLMLRHKFFHRAKKIVVQKEKKKKKEDDDEKEKEKEKEKKSKKSKDDKATDKEKKEGEEVEKKKEKKKIKLDMHFEQVFVDENEAYVWIYDPIPARAWIIGTLMVVGAVLVCLFPLWPKTVRHYVYYLSVAAAGFLVFIIALALLRLVVFTLAWILSFGKHHIWLLPNLTEDVGFFESFWPLYKYDYKGSSTTTPEDKSSRSTEDTPADKQKSADDERNDKEAEAGTKDSEEESGSEGSREGKSNGDNGFEILEAEDDGQVS